MRTVKVAAAVFVCSLALTGVAGAGGWWSGIDLKDPYSAPGMRVRAEAEVLFATTERAEQALRDGGFGVYVIEDLDNRMLEKAMSRAKRPGWWELGAATEHRVGNVRLESGGSNLARAYVEFTLPDLEPGRYSLMLCSEGCSRPLGATIPASIRVVEDPLTARLGSALASLRERSQVARANLRYELRTARREAQRAGATKQLLSAARALEAAPAPRAPKVVVEPAWSAHAGWFLAGLVAGGLLIGAGKLRRQVRSRRASTRLLDEELRELVSVGRP